MDRIIFVAMFISAFYMKYTLITQVQRIEIGIQKNFQDYFTVIFSSEATL